MHTPTQRQLRWFGLLALFVSFTLLAADLAIDSATWDGNRNRLNVSGTAANRAIVVISDAADGTPLSTVRADRRGNWSARISGLSQAPCNVQAASNGQSVEAAVTGAPADCNSTQPPPPPTTEPPPLEPPPPPTVPPTSLGDLQVLAANDLGMHCADLDYQIFSILPPFNVVHAQVLERGTATNPPRLLDNTAVGVFYSATSNPNDPAAPGSINTSSIGKTNFWNTPSGHTLAYDTYATLYPHDANGTSILNLFELIPGDRGLPVPDLVALMAGQLVPHQQEMPGAANTPRPFSRFDTDLPFFATLTVQGQTLGKVITGVNWFAADGIPILPVDDAGNENAYPLMSVAAHDSSGATRASVDVVLPVASEADCQSCHADPNDFGNGAATDYASVNNDADPANDFQVMSEQDAMDAHLGPQYLLNAAKVNILRLHDAKHGDAYTSSVDGSPDPCTTGTEDSCLDSRRAIQCSQCHYSPALDLAQVGPVDEQVVNGRQQTRHISMSRAMHGHHADLTFMGQPLFPAMPAPNAPDRATKVDQVLQETCYQCHPGKKTQCLRGAMAAGGVVCQDCHGDMAQVGNDFSTPLTAANPAPDGLDLSKRIPWASEPACQSCHTGDALNPNHPANSVPATDGIRLLQAYILGDPNATPIRSAGSRFAEDEPLYRLSKGHGGVMCEGCHGSTHAIYPNPRANANDNLASNQLQGHSGAVMECTTCHAAGSLGVTLGGPHGLHPVADSSWVRGHEGLVERQGTDSCKSCHGTDGLGTVLSRTPVERTISWSDDGSTRTRTFAKGTEIGCNNCHENKINGGD